MKNWVCYSVAVYMGLLMAGSLFTSRQAAAGPTSLVPPAHGQAYGNHPHAMDRRCDGKAAPPHTQALCDGHCPASQPAPAE